MNWFRYLERENPTGPPGELAFAHDLVPALNRFLPMANASQKRLRNASCRPPWSQCLLRTSRAFDLD